MSLSKIGRQLRREAAKSPQKAAVLGLLLVVALWFWAPLVVSWCKKDSPPMVADAKTTPDPTAAPVGGPQTVAAESAKPKETGAARHSWRELVAWREKDPRAQVVELIDARCDPFRVEQVEKKPVVAKAAAAPPAALSEITPSMLNLVLTSTLVGSERQVARINGRTYEAGSEVRFRLKDKEGTKIIFKLVEVRTKSVVLTRLGKEYELKTAPPKTSGVIEMLGSAP